MKRKNIILIMSLLGVILIAFNGCSSSKKAGGKSGLPVALVSPPADKAVIYVMRPSALGALINFKVELDGEPLGKTKGKQYFYIFAEPGNRTLVSIAENKSEVPILVESGKTYFFEQEVKMGIVKARNQLVRIDEVDARQKLKKCKLPKDFVAPQ